jgi:hypothetical protein
MISKGSKLKKELCMNNLDIERAQNGWVLSYYDEETDKFKKIIFQDDGDCDKHEAFADLLRVIDELLGPADSRHSPKRVIVSVEPGDKHPDHPSNREVEE